MGSEYDEIDLLVNFIIASISIILDFLVFFFYKSEESLYFKILKLISLFEIAFLYSKFLSIEESQNYIAQKIVSKDTFELLTYPIELNFGYSDINKYLYDATKTVYLILNIILSIETIKLIKQPFSHSKNKITFYYILSIILTIISLIIQSIIDNNEIYLYITDGFYFLFVLSGIICIVFIIMRFCVNNPLIQSTKNFFAVRHIIYTLFLIGLLVPDLKILNSGKFIKDIFVFSIGIIMSGLKVSEKILFRDQNTKKKSRKKGASTMVSSNLNVEFMCCILYGMTDIFMKNKYRKDESKSYEKRKTHSIKYLKTIDSKISDIKSVKLEVSSDQGQSLLGEEGGSGEDAVITEYFPEKFDELRKNDGITDDIMIKSFSPFKNKSAIEKMGEGKGKSGSFFFYSYDRKFIIKTITNEEKETAKGILLEYYNYVKEHKSSLITKIYGIYTLLIKNASSVNVILMQNLFGCSPAHIQRMFDLKGSTVQRKTKDVQKWKREQVLKDLDYQWVTQIERKLINFNESDIKEISINMENDIEFYKSLSLMDYSLLFIIIDYPNNIDPDYNLIVGLLNDPKYKGHVYRSTDQNYIYIIGIIDYLQKYNNKKRIENFVKGIYYGKEKNMISCVDPGFYGERFQNFMLKNVFVSEVDY